MERAYVFGCGQYFRHKQSGIIQRYDIVAILDNHKAGETMDLLNGKTVPVLRPIEAVEHKDIPIILMLSDFYSVWKELKELSIDSSRIIFPNNFLPYMGGEEIYNDDHGEFRIVDSEIYYENETRQYTIDSAKTLQDFPRILERARINASFIAEKAPVKPLNRAFGFWRGTPIDRYYIEIWLEKNKKLICGDVLEIAEDTYTKRFGGDNATPHILNVLEQRGAIKGDLETGEGISEESMDCIILTQTLPFIYNYKNVIANLYKMLRKGGRALITTGGIVQISRYDMDRWGHFWSFTDASLRKLIEESKFGSNYDMTVYGNVKTACALLYGVAAEELEKEELDYFDKDYPVSICAVLRK